MRPEGSSSEVGEKTLNSHVIMASLISGKAGASVIDNISSGCLIVTILLQKSQQTYHLIHMGSHRMDSAFLAYDAAYSLWY